MRAGSTLRIATSLVMALAVMGCAKLSPTGFWTTYRTALIVQKYSDQGPWGGIRWVHWVSPTLGTFTATDAVRFATSHGWVCQEPVSYSAEQLRMWRRSGKPVFPLHFGAADRPPNSRSAERFPRHIETDSLITTCDSKWTRVLPGSGEATAALGYIQVDRFGSRMAVYHLWGEI